MSAKVNWLDATEMINAYQNNDAAMKAEPPNGCEIIRGFKFEKADLQDILDHPDTNKVIVMPAVVKDDLSKPANQQTFTMIIAGLNNKGTIVTATAYDYSEPVLNSTPSNYPYIPTC